MSYYLDKEKERLEAQKRAGQPKVCKSAKVLRTIGIITLVVGCILAVVLFGLTCTVESIYGYGSDFNPMSIAWLLGVAMSSVVFWAFANSLASIDENIFELRHRKPEDKKNE